MIIKIILATFTFLLGFAIMDGNVNGAFKHNTLMGILAYALIICAVPTIIFW